MGSAGLKKAQAKMVDAGVDPVAIETFAHYFRLLEHGETGMIPESSIDPVDIPRLDEVEVPDGAGQQALEKTVAIKLNGGLGTSMGMERAKSLLCVRKGMSFLDIIARQILDLRKQHGVTLPLVLMNSFRTSADSLAALERYDDLAVEGIPMQFLQNKEPRLLADSLKPVTFPKDPELEWCPPGHGDIYTALLGSGMLDTLIEAGYRYAFVSNSDNLGAVPTPEVAGWFATSGAPFAIEAVRRTPSDRKGGHFAIRKADGRIVLRESAQTPAEDKAALADLSRHQFCSTNNIWFDLHALKQKLTERNGILGLPLIKNVKNVDPADKSTPEVIQIETAMGAAIEVFDDAALIEVGRDRFVPVKTTDDLLVLRSDVYDVGSDFVLNQRADQVPFIDLDADFYKTVGDFDKRFPKGAPSLVKATSLAVEGDWTFESGVTVVGEARLEKPTTAAARVAADTQLGNE